jgi:hypothetical protein
MKLPLLILVVLNMAVFAAERPTGFLGIPWGASPEEAKRVLKDRPGVKFPEESDDYHVEITGGSFAGQPVTKWVLEFPERKFGSASVTLKSDGNASAVFKEFRTKLSEKYGSGSDKKLSGGVSQVRKSYGTERSPVGSVTTWKFEPSMKEKYSVLIVAELAGQGGKWTSEESQLAVTIRYINEAITGPYAKGSASSAKPLAATVKKEDL